MPETFTGSFKIPSNNVPRFERRQGDWSQVGSNNSLIFLGTDRAASGGGPATVHDGLGAFTRDYVNSDIRLGAAYLGVGRPDPNGNPDLVADDAFLYMSSRTNLDSNLDVSNVNGGRNWENAEKPGKPTVGVALKSTNIRLVYRNEGDIRILSDGAKSFLVMSDKFVDAFVSDNIWMNAGGTKFEIRTPDNNDGVLRAGPLAMALRDLVMKINGVLSQPQLTVGLGNMMSPVPNNGSFQTTLFNALSEWKVKWINENGTGDYIKNG